MPDPTLSPCLLPGLGFRFLTDMAGLQKVGLHVGHMLEQGSRDHCRARPRTSICWVVEVSEGPRGEDGWQRSSKQQLVLIAQ